MSQETDDFDALEALLTSARKHADKMRERGALRRIARSREEISRDYAERLAEKATFRRLLSDEALDGVRFRFMFTKGIPHVYATWVNRSGLGIDLFRKLIDEMIAAEDSSRG